jgi:hypothetical protein
MVEMGVSGDDIGLLADQDWTWFKKHVIQIRRKQMKLRYVAPLAIAASAAAIALAPIASADVTVQQNPGNAQVTATPGPAAQQAAQLQLPFGGDMGALLYH